MTSDVLIQRVTDEIARLKAENEWLRTLLKAARHHVETEGDDSLLVWIEDTLRHTKHTNR